MNDVATTIEPGTETHDDALVQTRTPVYETAISDEQKKLQAAVSAGHKTFDGVVVWKDNKGRWIDAEMVRASDQLIDETVRKVMFFGEELAAQVTRFKGHSFEDMYGAQSMLFDEHEVEVGGDKGNLTLSTYDGSMKVEIKKAEILEFGPEIDIAKKLFDECVNTWAEGGDPKIKTIVSQAFNTNGGDYNRNELFSLLRYPIDDPKWLKAKEALQDAIRVAGTKTHLYMKKRVGDEGKFQTIIVNLANS